MRNVKLTKFNLSKLNIHQFDGKIYLALVLLSLLSLSNSSFLYSQKPVDAILVVSGGGARGAWGAGISESLDNQLSLDYKYAVGTSTGALLAPFIVIGDYDLLEEMYTGLGAKKGAVLRPRLYNKKGNFTLRSKIAAVLNGKSISRSEPLLELLQDALTDERYHEIDSLGIEVEVSAIGLEIGGTRFRSTKCLSKKEFIHWMWASSNQPAFMTPYVKREKFRMYSSSSEVKLSKKLQKKFNTKILSTIDIGNGVYEHEVESNINWVDGGAMENIPISRALEKSAEIKDIFIIINNKAPHQVYQTKSTNIVPFVNKKTVADANIEYSKVADKIMEWFNEQAVSEQNEITLDTIYEKVFNVYPSRISNKVELNWLDIERLTGAGTAKAASFDTDMFKIDNIKDGRRFKTKSVLDKVLATIDAFSKETLMNDLLSIVQNGNSEGKTFHLFFMPLKMYELNPASLQFNERNMEVLYNNGLGFDYKSQDAKMHSEYFRLSMPKGFDYNAAKNSFFNSSISIELAVKNGDKDKLIEELKNFDNIVSHFK